MSRRVILVSVITLTVSLIIGLLAYYNWYSSFANLIVSSNPRGEVTLYEAGFIDGSSFIVEESAQKLADGERVRIKKGNYLIIYKKGGYSTVERPVELESDQNISIKPTRTPDSLTKSLSDERHAIHQALSNRYPSILEQYRIDYEKLYNQGEWYGAILYYNNEASLQRDSVRIILRLTKGTWTVYTKPLLNISRMEYSGIPRDILEDINQAAPSDKKRYDTLPTAPAPRWD